MLRDHEKMLTLYDPVFAQKTGLWVGLLDGDELAGAGAEGRDRDLLPGWRADRVETGVDRVACGGLDLLDHLGVVVLE